VGPSVNDAGDSLHLVCARRVVGTLPPLMQEIRNQMRQAVPAGLSVPQFRVLILARRKPGASVSDVASHLGVTLPTASVAVDRLVKQGLLSIDITPDNRRRRSIGLTGLGTRVVTQAQARTTHALAERLSPLSPQQLALLQEALTLLEDHIAPDSIGTDA
jgi:DNA-binding MarR family transcriptional regulator